jgi:hypothetical protein
MNRYYNGVIDTLSNIGGIVDIVLAFFIIYYRIWNNGKKNEDLRNHVFNIEEIFFSDELDKNTTLNEKNDLKES